MIAQQQMQEFYYGYGRRKTSTASCRAFLCLNNSTALKVTVNGVDIFRYFASLDKSYIEKQIDRCFSASIEPKQKLLFVTTVNGGGVNSQLEAVMFAMANSVVLFLFKNRLSEQKSEIKYIMRKSGLLTFDNRQKEKKKSGQPKARKKRQFSKR